MSTTRNQVRRLREELGWSQETLAEKVGISRSGLSAIESSKLIPSVTTALTLSAALGCSVESLFSSEGEISEEFEWAIPPTLNQRRYWQATVGQRRLAYPAEDSNQDMLWHDGIAQHGQPRSLSSSEADKTLVIASCDPAARLLALEYAQRSPYRLLVLRRGSGAALKLLSEGLIHAAGIHLSHHQDSSENRAAAAAVLTEDFRLIHLARWEEGLALRSDLKHQSVKGLLKQRLRWIGRETGSGARKCLDEVLQGRTKPRREALDHQGVVNAIRCGWGDVGPCVRLSAEEAGLNFQSLRRQNYDLCFPVSMESDPRLQALIQTLRGPAFRQKLSELPGYHTKRSGEFH